MDAAIRTSTGIFTRLYHRILSWASHKYATVYLGILSFAESSFFPVPPDVILIPMCVAQPRKATLFASVATITSVLGGILGYTIGLLAAHHVHSAVSYLGYDAAYAQVLEWFHHYGFWVVFVAGFSPVPYKLFTLGAGTMGLAIVPFIVASAFGRGARFFLIAKLVAAAGPRLLPRIERYIEWIGWFIVALVVAVVSWLTFA